MEISWARWACDQAGRAAAQGDHIDAGESVLHGMVAHAQHRLVRRKHMVVVATVAMAQVQLGGRAAGDVVEIDIPAVVIEQRLAVL